MWEEVLVVDSVTTKFNYGLNKVRFTNPGARRRTRSSLCAVEGVRGTAEGGAQLTVDARIELEGSDRPAVVVEAVYSMFD